MPIAASALPRLLLAALLVVTTAPALSRQADAAQEVNIVSGYALHGHDPVAYFTQGKPVAGKEALSAVHEGATYRFASTGNRDMFAADPAKYAPQYGGYCAFGTAMGYKVDGKPDHWKIVDGKLYLNYSKNVQQRWNANVAGFIRGAENNWPLIRSVANDRLREHPPAGITQGPQ